HRRDLQIGIQRREKAFAPALRSPAHREDRLSGKLDGVTERELHAFLEPRGLTEPNGGEHLVAVLGSRVGESGHPSRRIFERDLDSPLRKAQLDVIPDEHIDQVSAPRPPKPGPKVPSAKGRPAASAGRAWWKSWVAMGAGVVLLVEPDALESTRLGDALEAEGFEVMVCPGPSQPEYVCVGGRAHQCS